MTASGEKIRSGNLPSVRGGQIHLPNLLSEERNLDRWKRAVNARDALVTLDLFCGAGGMSLGFEDAGFVVAAGIDSDPVACETHAANLLSKTRCIDLGSDVKPSSLMEELEIPRVDVIVGGPPCQGFSRAGMNMLRFLEAKDPHVREEVDARNRLYREFVQFVRELQPLFFVMENVPDLNSYAEGVIEREIRRDFGEAGYHVEKVTLNAAHFGVPQVRRRLFFIGSRNGRGWRLPRPAFRDQPRTLRDAIGDLPALEAPALEERISYGSTDENEYRLLMRSRVPETDRDFIYDHIARPVREDDREIFRMMEQGQKYQDVPEEYRRYRSDQFKDKYYKLKWDAPSVTITSHMAKDGYRYIHPEQIRTLSVREAARVQSFPDQFRFAGHRSSRYRQIGNAVPPLLARAIAQTIAQAIRQYQRAQNVRVEGEPDEESHWQLELPGFFERPALYSVDEVNRVFAVETPGGK